MGRVSVGLVGIAAATLMATGISQAQTSPLNPKMRIRTSASSGKIAPISHIGIAYKNGGAVVLTLQGNEPGYVYRCEVTGDGSQVERVHDKLVRLFGVKRLFVDCAPGSYSGAGTTRYTKVHLGVHTLTITSYPN